MEFDRNIEGAERASRTAFKYFQKNSGAGY